MFLVTRAFTYSYYRILFYFSSLTFYCTLVFFIVFDIGAYLNDDDDDDSGCVGGDADGRINFSGRLALDDSGCLLVLDVDGRRVLLFDVVSDQLQLVRELVSSEARLRYPARLCVDRRRRRFYIADNELSQRTRLQTKFWGKTGRIVVFETHPL